MLDLLTAALILFGAFFVLVGSVGLLRFPDFYTRLHAPTKATTLGLAGLILAYFVHSLEGQAGTEVREFLVMLFLFITAPVSAHMVARSALRRRVASRTPAPAALDDDADD